MLFKGVRAGTEVILATPTGRGAAAGFTYTLAEVEAVKSTSMIVNGYKFNVKDGKGRTVSHYVVPATPANRQTYLSEGGDTDAEPPAAVQVEDKMQKMAREALWIIRQEATPDQDDDVIDLFGAEALAAFRRQWRALHPGRQ